MDNKKNEKIFIIVVAVACIVSILILTSSNPQTNSNKNTGITRVTTTTNRIKNYQQIYDEYSQKLRVAGPTSSINEMAEIVNEGVMKMAEYMYSASGTDGQYQTYQEWSGKLYDVYLNECR